MSLTRSIRTSMRAVRSTRRGVASGLLVWATGFGAMNLFWFLGKWNEQVRGLWSYWSATVGDGLLLPVIMGTLTYEISKLPPSPREKPIGSLAAIVGWGLGEITIHVWTSDPSAEPNWTQANGQLNAAGQYHAIFLKSMLAALVVCAVVLGLRLANAQPAQVERFVKSRSLMTIVSANGIFVSLVVVDNFAMRSSRASLFSMFGVLFAFVVFLVLIRRFAVSAKGTGQ